MAKRFTIENVFKGVDKLSAPVTRMQGRVGRFTRSAGASVDRLSRKFGKLATSMGAPIAGALKAGGVAFGAASIAAITAVNRVAGSLDELAKRSRRLDFPIEALQEWQFVAEQSGLSSDLFDKSLEKFAKTLGEAKAGTGTLTTMLKKTNPALLEQLNNTTDVAAAFEIYQDAIRATEDQTVKTALATAAFGRSGAKVLNITEQSAEAIAKLRAEQRENGVATEQAARSAEAFNDAVNSLTRAASGLLRDAITPLLPELTDAVRSLRAWAIANRELVAGKVRQFVMFVVDAVRRLGSAVREVANDDTFVTWLQNIGAALSAVVGFLVDNRRAVLAIVTAYVGMVAALKAAQVAMFLFNGALTAVSIVTKVFTVATKAMQFAMVAGTVAVKAIGAAFMIFNAILAANPIGLIVLGITAAVAAFTALVVWVDEIAAAFDRWPVLKLIFAPVFALVKAVQFLKNNMGSIIDGAARIADKVGGVFGFGGDSDEADAATAAAPGIVSPAERTAAMISENNTTTKNEVVIRDETGRAEVTGGELAGGLQLQTSGAF